MQNKIFLWIALVTGFILVIPLISMRFNTGVNWTVSDFIAAGLLIFITGSIFVLGGRKIRTTKNRVILGIMIAAAFLYIWAELAVGIFTNWGS